ncbi:MAG: PEGA domain-containing protein [Planctomycetota bacterium]
MAGTKLRRLTLAVALLAVAAGCRGDRLLRVESTPPGATVRLDDVVIGRTPLEVPFGHYGRRRLSLYRPGYRTHTESLELKTPWYARFPIDVFTEVLLPLDIDDVRERDILLVPDTGAEAAPATEEFIVHALLARDGDELLDVPIAGTSDDEGDEAER